LNSDRIEKKVLLRAPLKRVWRAIADSNEFGTWFGLIFDGPFVQGAPLRGVIVPSTVNPEIAGVEKPHEGIVFDITIEKIEPERLFAFRWHPHAIKRDFDYSGEPTTLVVLGWRKWPMASCSPLPNLVLIGSRLHAEQRRSWLTTKAGA
jgi:uncharacterized protein YndB with AHSA1/START domain